MQSWRFYLLYQLCSFFWFFVCVCACVCYAPAGLTIVCALSSLACLCVCVRVNVLCARPRTRARVCMCLRESVRERESECVCVCVNLCFFVCCTPARLEIVCLQTRLCVYRQDCVSTNNQQVYRHTHDIEILCLHTYQQTYTFA